MQFIFLMFIIGSTRTILGPKILQHLHFKITFKSFYQRGWIGWFIHFKGMKEKSILFHALLCLCLIESSPSSILDSGLEPIKLGNRTILLFSVMVMWPKNEVTLQNWLNPTFYLGLQEFARNIYLGHQKNSSMFAVTMNMLSIGNICFRKASRIINMKLWHNFPLRYLLQNIVNIWYFSGRYRCSSLASEAAEQSF